jgi:hypothetical protein
LSVPAGKKGVILHRVARKAAAVLRNPKLRKRVSIPVLKMISHATHCVAQLGSKLLALRVLGSDFHANAVTTPAHYTEAQGPRYMSQGRSMS